MKWEQIRDVRFYPYVAGGAKFRLQLFDTFKTDSLGKSILAYKLTQIVFTSENTRIKTVLFEGSDFHCSPCHGTDSDECVRSLMGFLTLRPGDTDREYFADYTEEQLEFACGHAEYLGAEVSRRFGED